MAAFTPKNVSGTRTAADKPRRVRTGCLTCRERHLKCDEAVPDCMNCRKSNRHCKRGVRLNFLDITVYELPFMPKLVEWSVQFQDESREIASEYQDGIDRYAPYDSGLKATRGSRESGAPHKGARKQTVKRLNGANQRPNGHPPCSIKQEINTETSIYQGHDPALFDERSSDSRRSSTASFFVGSSSDHWGGAHGPLHREPSIGAKRCRKDGLLDDMPTQAHVLNSISTGSQASMQAAPPTDPTPPPANEGSVGQREFLRSPEEINYMRVFVEEVGVWMDSFDKEKHFSRLIPYHALRSPMLLNALLACGAKHMSLFSPDADEKALFYYNTATTQLLRSLQNPDRNVVECATAAVVLNVYEIMSEKPTQRMSHIAGARALIRECGWDASSTGIGSACFWLNIGMELLSCLVTNWQTTWDPEDWGLDLDFPEHAEDDAGIGQEEPWVHRILYIVAKIANFRATEPHLGNTCPQAEHTKLGRLTQWQELKELCDRWNNCCPRSMHPFAYEPPSYIDNKSVFPRIWLIKRASVIGRLFYHTAQCILAQTHPVERASDEVRVTQLHHAHQICGILAHTKDRGIGSVAIRSLVIASSVLVDRREQEEALDILRRIHAQSGWRLGMMDVELRRTWGWDDARTPMPLWQSPIIREHRGNASPAIAPPLPPPAVIAAQPSPITTRMSMAPVVAPSPMKTSVNPLSFADFSLPNHPYQNWYEPPNRGNSFGQPFM